MNEHSCGSKSCCKEGKCGSGCKCTHSALIISGIIFGLVALVHLYRAFYFFPVVIGSVAVGYNASIAILIISALLSLWMFFSACKCNKKCGCCCHKDKDVIDRDVPRDVPPR